MYTDEDRALARLRFADIVEHVELLAADANTQNAWLHPCGWSRAEPYWHSQPGHPCAPIAELVDGFFDMWPSWREITSPLLTPPHEEALDVLSVKLTELDTEAYVDELETLDNQQWADVRSLAVRTLEVLTAAEQHE